MTTLLAQADTAAPMAPAGSPAPSVVARTLHLPDQTTKIQGPSAQRFELETTRAIKLEQIDVKGPEWNSPEVLMPALVGTVVAMAGAAATVYGLLRATSRQIKAASESSKRQIESAHDSAERQIAAAQATMTLQLEQARIQTENEAKHTRDLAHSQWHKEVLTGLVGEFTDLSHSVQMMIAELPRVEIADISAVSSVMSKYNAVANKLTIVVDEDAARLITDLQTRVMKHHARALLQAMPCMQMVASIKALEADILTSRAMVKEASDSAIEGRFQT